MNKKFYLIIAFALLGIANLAAQTKVVFNSCDNSAGWNRQVDLDSKKEGAGSITASDDNAERFIWHSGTGFDTNVTRGNGYMSFWLYISDVSKIDLSRDGQIEIRSGEDTQDDYELNWSVNETFRKHNVVNGWNKIILKLSEGNPTLNAIDLSSIKYFRIYTFLNNALETKIDNIVFYAPAINVLDNCDVKTSEWDGNGAIHVDATDSKDGEASMMNNGKSNELRFRKNLSIPMNFAGNQYLAFWFYIDDRTKLPAKDALNGQVEISSSGGPDTDEYHWEFNGFTEDLHTGWNKIVLRIDENTGKDGTPDLENINFFRIYLVGLSHDPESSQRLITKIDKITFLNDPNLLPVKLEAYTAIAKNASVNLQWKSASEVNVSHYNVLHSTNATDFKVVKTVKAKGVAATYNIADYNTVNGTNYYKLVSVDNDGTSAHLGTKAVAVSVAGTSALAYPTNVADKFTVNITDLTASKVIVTLTDVSGKKVFANQYSLVKGQTALEIAKPNSALKGVYVLNVSTDKTNKSTKLVFN